MRRRLVKHSILAYLFLLSSILAVQEITSYLFRQYGSIPLYFEFSGLRLPVLIGHLFVAGFLLGRTSVDDHVKLYSVGGATATFLLRTYVICGRLDCHYVSDPLQPLRFTLLMAGLVLIGDLLGEWSYLKSHNMLKKGARPYLMTFSIIYVLSYFPSAFIFAGVQGHPLLGFLRVSYLLLAVPAAAILVTVSAFNGTSRAFITYVASVTSTLVLFAEIPCSSCVRPLYTLLLAPIITALMAVFALHQMLRRGVRRGQVSSFGRRAFYGSLLLATVLMLPVSMAFGHQGAVPQTSTEQSLVSFQVPQVRPYVGVYASIPYTSTCCVSAVIVFLDVDLQRVGVDNYLKAGIGVQSPNCCVDGLDYGYRLDLYLLWNGMMSAEASVWETCDVNLACGGIPWQRLLFSKVIQLNEDYNRSRPVYFRVSLEMSHAGDQTVVQWFLDDVNSSGAVPFAEYVAPDIALPIFSVGVYPLHPLTNLPYHEAYFLQFGLESAYPAGDNGWSVAMLYPKYVRHDDWVIVEHARVIHGDASYWKVLWLWGGLRYHSLGIETIMNAENPGLDSGVVGMKFHYSGIGIEDHVQLW